MIQRKPHVAHNSGENEWYTERDIAEAVRSVLGEIDLDPASTPEANAVIKAKRFFSKADDGLAQDWYGRVFLNPPYARLLIANFIAKLIKEIEAGHTTEAIVLVNNATETKWFQMLLGKTSALCFPEGRRNFWYPGRVSAPLQGQAIAYVGTESERFYMAFRSFGFVGRPPSRVNDGGHA